MQEDAPDIETNDSAFDGTAFFRLFGDECVVHSFESKENRNGKEEKEKDEEYLRGECSEDEIIESPSLVKVRKKILPRTFAFLLLHRRKKE